MSTGEVKGGLRAVRLRKGDLDAKPSVALTGRSGSGKTTCIGMLLKAGYRVAMGDQEGKVEGIQKYEPLVIPITGPQVIADALALMGDPERRREWARDMTGGEWDDIDIYAHDSLLEYEWDLDSRLDVEYKTADNKYTRWDVYGRNIINLCRAMRQLSGSHMGKDAIGTIMTIGMFADTTPMGGIRERIPLRGNMAPPRLEFLFSYVLHCRAQAEAGEPRFYLDTVSTEAFEAKGPGPTVLPATVDITVPGGRTDFASIWKRLEASLREEV